MIYTLYLLKLPAWLLILAERTNIIIGFLNLLRTEFHYAISLYKYTADFVKQKQENVKTSLLFNYFSLFKFDYSLCIRSHSISIGRALSQYPYYRISRT